MSSPAPTRFTEVEYLALEAASDRKHEYVDGIIVAMAGARPPHNQLAANMTAVLVELCRSTSCVTMTGDQRVHVPATKLYAYPDVTVTCGERRYDGGDPPSLSNPTVLVEVTSYTTEDFDRVTKFLHYQSIASLEDYLIVSHRERRFDQYHRLDDGRWHLATHSRDDAAAELSALKGIVRIADVYRNVDLTEGRP